MTASAATQATKEAPRTTGHRMPAFPAFEVSGRKGSSPYMEQPSSTRPAAAAVHATPADAKPAATFEEQVDAVVRCVCTQNLLREVLYKLLVHCSQRRDMREAEAFVAQQDEFVYSHIEQTPHALIRMLVDAGGLDQLPLGQDGAVVDRDTLAALPEDEADDLVESYALLTTEAGKAAASLLEPRRRLRARLAERPHRSETYRALLSLCAQAPQTLPQIEQFFKDTPGLALDRVTSYHTLSPDYYVDQLEKCGAIVWRGAWCATQAGLEELASWPDPASHSA